MNENKLINHVIKTYSCESTKFASTFIDSITYKEFCTQCLYELNLVYFDKSIRTYKAYFNINYAHDILTRYNIKNTELLSWWSLCRFTRLFNWIWFHDSKIIILQLFSEEELFSSRVLMTLFKDGQFKKHIDIYAHYDQLVKYGFNDKYYKYILNTLEKCKNQRLALGKTKYIESE